MTNGAVIPRVADDQIVTAFSNEILHLIILPTEQCNFRCVYCYEDFSVGTMKAPVIAGVKRLLARRIPTLRQLHIGWFGGEPLIALNVIEDISKSVKSLTCERSELTYTSEVTTNAYRLDLATAERLSEMNVRHYQITLDGPPEFHDQTRIQRNGQGSFERVWGNLLALRSSSLDLSISLRVHVTPANLIAMPEFLLRIRKAFLDDPRFVVLIKAVGHWGGPNDDKFDVLDATKGADEIKALEELVSREAGTQSVYHPGNVCYASRPNSLLIRASGDVGKCTVALSDPANSIGRLLEDGNLELRSDSLKPWLRGWNSADADVLECPLVGLPRSSGEPVLMQIGAGPGAPKGGHGEASE
ncbi:radical SAM protein [Streptomyces sp. B1I3]|uniref:radical SAM protein n=1 Tax=Streptomyces sp. B1I3 TaxID=3042264 RepID=UPI0027D8D47E|nr:radical SAM protein [Streptomyces sp. B1I3]